MRLVLFLVIVSLSACTVNVEPGPDPEPEDITISNIAYESEFTARIDGETRDVICDDRNTKFSYSFDYSGDLTTWSSYLQGVDSGTINEDSRITRTVDATPEEGVVTQGDNIAVYYTLTPESAPTLTAPSIDTQGIVVEPIVKGFTQLFISVEGTEPVAVTPTLPVLEACSDENVREEAVEITSASYTTGFELETDGENTEIICDDRKTNVVVDFEYTGDLTSFNLRAVGKRDGVEREIATYTENQIPNVGFFSGVVPFENGQAPRLIAGGKPTLSTQGIVIAPEIVGETLFYVQPNQTGDYELLDFEIPIAAVCAD